MGQDINSAEEAGVAGTPTFFIDEVRHRGRYDLESLEAALVRIGALASARRAAVAEDAEESRASG